MRKYQNKTVIIKYIVLSLLLFSLLGILIPKGGHGWDIYCWKLWSKYIFENGLGNVYESSSNYLPLYYYILDIYSHVQGNVEKINDNIHYLKYVTLFFHFITGLFLLLVVGKEGDKWWMKLINAMFYLLNFAVLYNSIVWGQVDAILTCFIFISVYFSIERKVLMSLVFFVLAMNFKLQAVVFFPVIGLLLFSEMILTFSYRKLFAWVLVPLVVQVFIILPFMIAGNVGDLYCVIVDSLDKFPVVSLNAFNVWEFMLSGNVMNIKDSGKALGISYKNWGLFLFFTTSLIALTPLIKFVFYSVVKKTKQHILVKEILNICALIPLLFFYFNTQMHERYSHPALVFLIGYSIFQRRPLFAIIGSFAYFLNLEAVLQFFNLNYESFIFNRDFISSLFLLTILMLYADLFGFSLRARSFLKTYFNV
ncbi:MAG: hypothetical protein ACEPOZ_20705 [Marinifilaceae bacterium]